MVEKKLSGDVDQHNRAVPACLEVGKLLTSTLDLRQILEHIMTKVSELIDAQNWSLLLKDEATGDLIFEIMVGVEKELAQGLRIAGTEGIAGHVSRTGEPLFLEDARRDKRFSRKVDERTGFKTESIVCVPLKNKGNILGVVEIVNVKDLASFQAKDLPVLEILADYAAIAIENARYVSRIHRMSITDEYTGLYNARFLHEKLEEMIREAEQRDEPLAVVFVDVDNFKQIVDTCGHLLGSRVLKEIGETMASCISPEDILVKYGGDEYVILLPGRNRQEARKVVEGILHGVRSTTYLASEPEPVKTTASFGISVYPEDARTKKEILLGADRALYAVKESTKNGVGTL